MPVHDFGLKAASRLVIRQHSPRPDHAMSIRIVSLATLVSLRDSRGCVATTPCQAFRWVMEGLVAAVVESVLTGIGMQLSFLRILLLLI
jgi:hypothetical protein